MNHLCLFPKVLLLSFLREILNIPTFRVISLSIEGVPYALQLVTHIKNSEVSLLGYEISLKYLSLYLSRNKIVKAKSKLKNVLNFSGLEEWPQIRLQFSS